MMDQAVVERALAEGALAYLPQRMEHSSRTIGIDPAFLAEAEAALEAGAAAIPEQKNKCCWFPFKNAYMARQRIADMSTLQLKDEYYRRGGGRRGGGYSSTSEVDTTSSYDIGSTADERSTASKAQSRGSADSPISVASEIPLRTRNNNIDGGVLLDSNCIGKPELWVDEIVQGGPWSCVEESFQPNKKKTDGSSSVIKIREIEDHLEEFPTYPLPKVEVIHEELPSHDNPPSRGDRPRSRSPADKTSFGDSFDTNSLLDSLGSKSLLDDDITHNSSHQLRRAFCGRTNVDLIRPTNEARRKPDFTRSFDFPEEKKEDDPSYEYTQNHSLLEEHMLMPAMRDFGTTSPNVPATADEYSSERLGWIKNLAAGRGKKPMLCGPQRVDDMACKKRTFLPQSMSFDPRQYSRVQSTDSAPIPHLDPENWGAVEEAHERPLSTHENLRSILKNGGVASDNEDDNNISGCSSNSSTDLKVVRQSPSLVDMDSAFMGSEDKSEQGVIPCGPRRGYFPTATPLKERSLSRQAKQELETLHEGSLESNSNNSNSNSESSSKSISQGFEGNSNGSVTVSDHDSNNDWEDSTTSDSSSSSFQPPPEIKSRVRSGRKKFSTNRNGRNLLKTGIEGKTKTDRSSKNITSESKRSDTSEDNRRSRSIPQQQRQHGEEMVEFFVPEKGRSHTTFQREPINALSSARGDEGYKSFHNANGRDYNGDLASSTTNQRLGLPLKHEYTTMSNDFGAFLATNGNDDGDRIFTTYPRRSSHFSRPKPQGLKDLPFQPTESSGMQRAEPAAQKRSKSPRRPKPAPVEAVQSPLDPKPAEDFFDDVSDLGTDAFRQYQTDEEDSIFDGIRSDESSSGGLQQADDSPRRHNSTGSARLLDGEALYEKARLGRMEKTRLDRIWMQETVEANKKDEFAWNKWMDS